MTLTNAVMLSAKLYETRNAMRFLAGDNYIDRVKPLVDQLHALAATLDCSMIEALTTVTDDMRKGGADGIALGMVIAAYVEDIEGTFLTGELVKET